MAAGIQFTSYVPTSLVGNNSPSPTLAAEVVTGLPIPTGAFPGNCFYLTEQQANQLSQSPVNGATELICHAGWYMVAKIDAGANAANLQQGAVVAQKSIPTTNAAANASIPPTALLTDASNVLSLGQNPAILLNPVTPGNFTIVQLAGDASVLLAASQTVAVGNIIVGTASGLANQSGSYTNATLGTAEAALTTPAALTLSAAAAASGGSTVYTGTITGGGSNAFAGLTFVVAGFDLAANNGTFVCTASTTTTLTLSNANGVADTHAGTATSQALLRVNLAPAFGSI